jgi:hypothetical protein
MKREKHNLLLKFKNLKKEKKKEEENFHLIKKKNGTQRKN